MKTELLKINPKFITLLKKTRLYIPLKNFKDNVLARYSSAYKATQTRRIILYDKFLKEGDLCFDLGANTGDEARNLLDMGMKVISVEPVEYCIKYMNKRFKKDIKKGNMTIERAIVGNEIGEGVVNVCTANAMSSVDNNYGKIMKERVECSNLEWNEKEKVPMITLNSLCEKYGIPKFVKIDVEGYEYEVLKNLKYKIPAMSIEFYLDFGEDYKKITRDCIRKMESLGNYEFNITLREQMLLLYEDWKSGDEIIQTLDLLNKEIIFGDIFMRLKR